MRISDWSSDVCSSDLPRHQGKGLVDDLQTSRPAIRTNPGAGDALSTRGPGLGRADRVRPRAGAQLAADGVRLSGAERRPFVRSRLAIDPAQIGRAHV